MKWIKIEIKNHYAIVEIDRGKVNAINHELVSEIRSAFETLEKDSSILGVILTGKPNYFSAGLDLIELYQYDHAQSESFFEAFGLLHIELVKFSKPFICAISGHSPAGGTVIAVAADYRIMAQEERYTIGLNEVSVNVQISQNLITAYNFWLGTKQAYQNIMAGKLLSVEEAFQQGLIDEICSLEMLMGQAEKKMHKYLRADQNILANTKQKLRKQWIESLHHSSEVDMQQTLEVWWNPKVRAMMKAYIQQFSGKVL